TPVRQRRRQERCRSRAARPEASARRPCTLNGSGQCSVSYTPSAGSVGSHTVTAAYGGDADQSPSSGTTTVTATKRSTATAVGCRPGSEPVNSNTPPTAPATDTATGTAITPTGTVSFTSSAAGTFSPSSCSLNGSGQCSV